MLACILCLEELMHKQMEIFSAEGVELEIESIICKYFWIKPNKLLHPEQQICYACWNKLIEFHEFHLHVAKVHNYLESVPSADIWLTDPLPHNVEPNFEDKTDIKEELLKNDFHTEIKVEVNELEFLPNVEVIEENIISTKRKVIKSEKRSERTKVCSDKRKLKESTNESLITKRRRRHVETHFRNVDYKIEQNTIKCTKCDIIFEDKKSFKRHCQEMHAVKSENKKLYPCQNCDKVLTTKTTLEYHINAYHVPESEFRYICTEHDCNKKFPSERKLKEHAKLHDPESTFICDKCGKILRNKSKLKKHHQMKHSDEPVPMPEPKQCPICHAWLKNAPGLRKHILGMHDTSGVEHRCPICSKVSSNAQALKRHIFFNHKCERKYKCNMCEKAFKRPTNLKEHISTHTGEILYTCPYCPMTFKSNANMYRHRQRSHHAELEADNKKSLLHSKIRNNQNNVVGNTIQYANIASNC
ncbi:zinc finger protein 729-like [Teleopsis dalmanni]|uniref:zinc finger protein 729-like n=1 Tax=Teleopsis dalmanni TaxID=139649 RepID=UPI0018CCCCA1|nr:zinc finger protein 729-like [Teleopsis dalmanni]XP_037945422.1 zinc finger protein 729-like [Teleopsis dalmanni]